MIWILQSTRDVGLTGRKTLTEKAYWKFLVNEKEIIKDMLVACQFNQVRTAEQLGISRQGLIKKINRYHIRVKELRDEVYDSL